MPMNAPRFDSRQSMKNKRFEVFHYRDQKMENIGVHHHDFYEIYFFLSGNVCFRVEGRTYHLEPGDLLLINPQELHQPEIGPDNLYERIVLWIDRGFLAALCDTGVDLTTCFDREAPNHTNLLRPSKMRRASIGQMLERMNREYHSKDMGSEAYARGLLLQFMVEINRLARTNTTPAPKRDEPDLVNQVLAYIAGHYQENITLESLAAEFFVSKYHLSHEFSHRVGTSVYRYVIFRRLMQARELMAEGKAPGEVYQSCGFGDYANFYRAFKGEYGIGPREFAANMTQ